MLIKFKKDLRQYKKGQTVADHPHAEYLVRVGAAEVVKEKVKEKQEHSPEKKEKKATAGPTAKKKK